jgi:hypothetical protein
MGVALGALSQLLQPFAWRVSNDLQRNQILDWMDTFRDVFAQAGACVDLTFDFGCDGGLRWSVDAGATFTAVPGWLENFCSCAVACARDGNVGVVLMQPGVFAPPVPVQTPDGKGWVYAP